MKSFTYPDYGFYSSCLVILLSLFLLSCGDDGRDYERPLLAVKQGDNWGFIDRSGEIVIEPIYAYAFDFSERRAAVNIGGTSVDGKVPQDGKWGFINVRDTIVINPVFDGPPQDFAAPYDPAGFSRMMYDGYVFSESLAAVRREGEWVYIDSIGNVVIRSPRTYNYASVRSFHKGLAAVQISTSGRWGFIDKTGELVIPDIFRFPSDFQQETNLLTDMNGDKVLINRQGTVLLGEYRLEKPFFEGYAPIKGKFKEVQRGTEDETLYGLIDIQGNILIEPQFDRMGEYGSGMAPVLMGSQQEDLIRFPSTSISTSYKGGKWSFVDEKRQIQFEPVYQEAHPFRQGYAAVKKNGKWGYLKPNGEFLVKPSFIWAGNFHDYMAIVRLGQNAGALNGRYAYIDLEGDVFHVLEP